MKNWMKSITLFIWGTLFLYLVNFFGIPKNIYYFLIGVPFATGIGLLIIFLFEKSDDTNKK
ncbi:hypothetical protein AT864_00539 [Anoxybacillus sp. P3H1B]|jgi:hypothetical protein|nr:hypothetical protein AT864_00539 [Anoxybacillus sp. P3H1B]MBB3907218.1 hypothetical protein [Anoxybacillus rupiensis]OQM44795.1 hypothetical protein B6A27_12115 [Anoxybacillus sp. UARK-01]